MCRRRHRSIVRWNVVAPLLIVCGAIALMAGCVAAPEVQIPKNASLLFMGYPRNFSGTRPAGPGRAYLYDEAKREVVAVMAVTADQDFHFSGLDVERRFRVYFEPDNTLKGPTSNPI